MDLRLERDADLFGRALERLRDLLALLVLDHLALGPSENVRLRDQARTAHLNSEGGRISYWFDLLPIKSLLVKNVGRRNGDSVPSRLG